VDVTRTGYARELLESMPAVVRGATAPEDAEAVLLAIALSPDGAIQRIQREAIIRAREPGFISRVLDHRDQVRTLAPATRLPALQHLFPRVRELPASRRETLRVLLSRIALSDGELDVFEFCLARLASTWLRDSLSHREPSTRRRVADVRGPLGTLLSVLATFGHPGDESSAQRAFVAASAQLAPGLGLVFGRPQSWAASLWRAFDHLDTLAPPDRRAVIGAMVAAVMHDGRLREVEADLLRTACAVLHCPLPLLGGLAHADATGSPA
jgi:hypothetical protein